MTPLAGPLVFLAFWLLSILLVGAIFNWFGLVGLLPLAAVAIIAFAVRSYVRSDR